MQTGPFPKRGDRRHGQGWGLFEIEPTGKSDQLSQPIRDLRDRELGVFIILWDCLGRGCPTRTVGRRAGAVAKWRTRPWTYSNLFWLWPFGR
jgi:hypothetical protein